MLGPCQDTGQEIRAGGEKGRESPREPASPPITPARSFLAELLLLGKVLPTEREIHKAHVSTRNSETKKRCTMLISIPESDAPAPSPC